MSVWYYVYNSIFSKVKKKKNNNYIFGMSVYFLL